MKSARVLGILVLALGLMVWAAAPSHAGAVGTGFTYQGRLIDGNDVADGLYDFQFKLYDNLIIGLSNQVGDDVNRPDVDVIDGYFTVYLDFGEAVFDGNACWLEIGVRPGELEDPNVFTILEPRQKITPAPYAIYALNGGGGNGHSLDAADGDPVDAVYVDNEGNVGIGTKNPQVRLSLGAEIPPTPKKLAIWDGLNDFYGFGADWGKITIYANDDEKMAILNTGNVGIGTTAPGQKLDVDHGNIVVQGTGSFDSIGEEGTVYLGSIHNYIKAVYGFGVKVGAYGPGDILSIRELSGRVGIGTTEPCEALEVRGAIMSSGTGAAPSIRLKNTGAGADEWRITSYDDGRLLFWNKASLENRMAIDGDGKVSVKVLEITGGSDVSEQFEITTADAKSPPSAGMVVSIDPENPGDLVVSTEAYDRRVAGIISGAGGVKPGMLMGQKGSKADGANPVALTGRVYCWADASNNPIEPGDLLTTSDTPGHAMKVGDYGKAQGAVLGKAMTPLAEGKGLVLILVTLQ